MVLKDTEKVAAGALRQALQTWLAPQLSSIGERLAHIEGEVTGLRGEISALRGEMGGLRGEMQQLDKRTDQGLAGLRSEVQAGFRSVDDRIDALKERADQTNRRIDDTNKRIDEALDIRERLVVLEARMAARHE